MELLQKNQDDILLLDSAILPYTVLYYDVLQVQCTLLEKEGKVLVPMARLSHKNIAVSSSEQGIEVKCNAVQSISLHS